MCRHILVALHTLVLRKGEGRGESLVNEKGFKLPFGTFTELNKDKALLRL